MSATSGLRGLKRRKAVKLTLKAARLAYHHAPVIHYTQGPDRWEGIDQRRKAYLGQYPHNADCSSFSTWCLWNGLSHFYLPDTVNGEAWKRGYTGTLNNHGKSVRIRRRGDLVFYGDPYGPTGHVATYVGRGRVISHGSEGGPYYCPVGYRSDVHSTRRYI